MLTADYFLFYWVDFETYGLFFIQDAQICPKNQFQYVQILSNFCNAEIDFMHKVWEILFLQYSLPIKCKIKHIKFLPECNNITEY